MLAEHTLSQTWGSVHRKCGIPWLGEEDLSRATTKVSILWSALLLNAQKIFTIFGKTYKTHMHFFFSLELSEICLFWMPEHFLLLLCQTLEWDRLHSIFGSLGSPQAWKAAFCFPCSPRDSDGQLSDSAGHTPTSHSSWESLYCQFWSTETSLPWTSISDTTSALALSQ